MRVQMAGDSCVLEGSEERSFFLGMHQLSLDSVNPTPLVQGSQKNVCAGNRDREEEEEEEESSRTTFPTMLFKQLSLESGQVLGCYTRLW